MQSVRQAVGPNPRLILNMLALAARFSGTSSDGEVYGKLACKYLMAQLESPHIELVIACLLLSVHAFALRKVNEATMFLSVGVRMVYELDLHKECKIEDRDYVHDEMCRTAFWRLFIVDRLSATKLCCFANATAYIDILSLLINC